jgi:hypothetical protein
MYIIQRTDGQYYASAVKEPLGTSLYWSPLKSKATQFTAYYQAEQVQRNWHECQQTGYALRCNIIDLSTEQLEDVEEAPLPAKNLYMASASAIKDAEADAIAFMAIFQSNFPYKDRNASAITVVQEYILQQSDKTSIASLATGVELKKFQGTSQYRVLMAKYTLDTDGLWLVRGEDPNCEMGGPQYTPALGTFSGPLGKVIEHAVLLPKFWGWGDGGDISMLTVEKL